MQLDLFEHSRDVVLRNRAIEAAHAHDSGRLALEIDSLAREYPLDPLLPALEALQKRMGVSLRAKLHRQEALDLIRLTEQTIPAAERVFGTMADGWLAPLWEGVAAAIVDLAFDPHAEPAHAVPLLLRAGRWAEASERIETIRTWRRQPMPLSWKVESEYRQHGLFSAWPYFTELCWMAPENAALLARRLTGEVLSELLRLFQMQYEGDGDDRDFAWLPAWSVIADTRWAAGIRLTDHGTHSPAERFARQLLEVLSLERQGRHAAVVAVRRTLHDINPQLFALYMKTR